eukprot:GHRQ01026738.1.p1 GENE.GHRQ01026738.1~~GHRQ01026738.1.p1  ORF type:complete len:175 (+),score=51.50 GHRQ01026738.1:450-974(+)
MHAPAGVWCALYPLPACSCTSILLWSHGVAVTVCYLGSVLQDGHTTVSWHQLSHWEECAKWEGFTASNYTAGSTTVSFSNPCDYFTVGRSKASTLSLSVLVAIEMFNAYNALSEDNSLLQVRPWSNPWLALATCVSLGLHCVILYVPFLAQVRGAAGMCTSGTHSPSDCTPAAV